MGFCVFNSEPYFNAGIAVAEMLGRANFLALVGGGKQPKFPQNKVVIWDDAKEKAVITLEFRTPVQSVRLSRTRIVVVLRNSVHIYSFSSPPEKVSAFETTDNTPGLCCLGTSFIAFPGRTPGQVQLVEAARRNVSIIPAHAAPLRALALSANEELLATASETGTLIRIFSTANCARVAELRRGVDHATIFSLAISPSSTLLAVTSDKSTLHIFDLPHALDAAHPEPTNSERQRRTLSNASIANAGVDEGESQKWGILGKIPMMPRVFSDVYSFTSAHFEMGDEPVSSAGSALPPSANAIMTGIPGGRPAKGVIGWTSDESLIILGAGRDGRWERFLIGEDEEGKRRCFREGWRRYLGQS
ncbi:MAG: Phosphatidylinositol 3,5-bisphosphate-binding protein [Thelocarpon superellum]|nr:MAG: Phosphatidylinositol 3,5-bisphosphate-binding protein [Thelocarpon superellum]